MLTFCSATGELPKGLELERCRGHGFVDFERSHGGKGNATVSAFYMYVGVSECLLKYRPVGYAYIQNFQAFELK